MKCTARKEGKGSVPVHMHSVYIHGVHTLRVCSLFFRLTNMGRRKKNADFFFFKLVMLSRYNYIFSTSRG